MHDGDEEKDQTGDKGKSYMAHEIFASKKG
jgi:hypothetical protein